MSLLLLLSDDAPNPRSLFAAGEQGFWYDPSDFSTLFQDAAGTTPVTAVGQSVGRILDKSGRGNHATQSTALSRPTLQRDATGRYYLSLDGTDDGMATPSIDFTGTDKMTVWLGTGNMSPTTTGVLCELSAGSAVAGGISIYAPRTAGVVGASIAGVGGVRAGSSFSADAASRHVVSIAANLSASGYADEVKPRLNGLAPAVSSMDTTGDPTGAFGNHALYIGRRGGTTLPFNGRIYQLIGRGAETPLAQIVAMEQYVNAKTGAY